MGYSIQPVQIWQNGESEIGNFIDASIVNDNLTNYAQFYWEISNLKIVTNTNYRDIYDENGNVIGKEEFTETETVKTILQRGNTTISGENYVIWDEATDVNLAAYQYICTQLNLTLIP
ncbi:MAG: hypothetical protein EBZ61_09675 [Micrococcales bacterium]|nr:hypothetical protein [Micrococcales bacterium]